MLGPALGSSWCSSTHHLPGFSQSKPAMFLCACPHFIPLLQSSFCEFKLGLL